MDKKNIGDISENSMKEVLEGAQLKVGLSKDQGVEVKKDKKDTFDYKTEGTNSHTNDDSLEKENPLEEESSFQSASKETIIAEIKKIHSEENIQKNDKVLKKIKYRFNELYEFSKNEALQKFISEGNEVEAFEYHGDEIDKKFKILYEQLRDKSNKYYKNIESEKENNLNKKKLLLEQLRTLVDGGKYTKNIDEVRNIQEEWKNTGHVSKTHSSTLWANYNALLNRYYDNRGIYFELKDLDKKKNLEIKEKLCIKAEGLTELKDIKKAIAQLNDLHEEYKQVGAISNEYREEIWKRFKKASDIIYSKRRNHLEELKNIFEENFDKKTLLIEELHNFTTFDSDRITEWNERTKKILEIQKQWESIGGVSKEKFKNINKAFWNSFKTFYSNKNKFFKTLGAHKEENLVKKQKLIEKAEALKNGSDWNSIVDKLKHLQEVWKDIGPVPEKNKQEVNKTFTEACNHFFNRRRKDNQIQMKKFDENLKLKLQVCNQLEQMAASSEIAMDSIYELIDNYTSIGYVPRNAIKKTHNKFDKITSNLLANDSLSMEDREELENYIELGRLKNTSRGKEEIQEKEKSIKRKMTFLKNDIATWNTNIDFFAQSTTADKLKAEIQEKIDSAERELKKLKSHLEIILYGKIEKKVK